MTYVSYIAPVFPAPICTLRSTRLISVFIYTLSCVLYLPLSCLGYWLCVFLAGAAAVLRWLWQRISHVLPEASNDPASWRWAPPFQVLFNTDAKKAMRGGIKGHIPVTLSRVFCSRELELPLVSGPVKGQGFSLHRSITATCKSYKTHIYNDCLEKLQEHTHRHRRFFMTPTYTFQCISRLRVVSCSKRSSTSQKAKQHSTDANAISAQVGEQLVCCSDVSLPHHPVDGKKPKQERSKASCYEANTSSSARFTPWLKFILVMDIIGRRSFRLHHFQLRWDVQRRRTDRVWLMFV